VSVLLIGAAGDLPAAVADRLIAQGDEVRTIATDPALENLATLGVRIARGPYLDADLVERSAQNVRTIVLFEADDEVLEAIIEGAAAAGVDRVVLCSSSIEEPVRERLRASGLEYVVLQAPRKGRFRKGVPDEALAEAVDAADDMAGRLRLELNLNERDAWQTLKLEVPSRS
jgi:uncharacterized protein YbjT (DUF2867 family)